MRGLDNHAPIQGHSASSPSCKEGSQMCFSMGRMASRICKRCVWQYHQDTERFHSQKQQYHQDRLHSHKWCNNTTKTQRRCEQMIGRWANKIHDQTFNSCQVGEISFHSFADTSLSTKTTYRELANHDCWFAVLNYTNIYYFTSNALENIVGLAILFIKRLDKNIFTNSILMHS